MHAVKNSNDLFLHEDNHQNPVVVVDVDREKQSILVECVALAGRIHETFVFMNTRQQQLGKMCFHKTIFCDDCSVLKKFRSAKFVSHLKGIKTKVDDTVVEPIGAFQCFDLLVSDCRQAIVLEVHFILVKLFEGNLKFTFTFH